MLKMKRSLQILTAGAAIGFMLMTSAPAEAAPVKGGFSVGIVNFGRCLQESKFGKQEQKSLENLSKQLAGTVEGSERELNDIVTKLRDPDYRDSLSPEAEQQMMTRFETLRQELGQQQQQFAQIRSQAEMKALQDLNTRITSASQTAAKASGANIVLRDEAAFYFPDTMDLTQSVIAAMDHAFETENAADANS